MILILISGLLINSFSITHSLSLQRLLLNFRHNTTQHAELHYFIFRSNSDYSACLERCTDTFLIDSEISICCDYCDRFRQSDSCPYENGHSDCQVYMKPLYNQTFVTELCDVLCPEFPLWALAIMIPILVVIIGLVCLCICFVCCRKQKRNEFVPVDEKSLRMVPTTLEQTPSQPSDNPSYPTAPTYLPDTQSQPQVYVGQQDLSADYESNEYGYPDVKS